MNVAIDILKWAVLLAISTLLYRSVKTETRQEAGRHILEYGGLTRFSVGFALSISVFLLYGVVRSIIAKSSGGATLSQDDKVGMAVCTSIALLLIVYIPIEFFWRRVEYDDEAIYTFFPWRSKRRIPWKEITSCRYSEVNRWLVIKSATHGTARISIYLSGFRTFLERIPVGTEGLAAAKQRLMR